MYTMVIGKTSSQSTMIHKNFLIPYAQYAAKIPTT